MKKGKRKKETKKYRSRLLPVSFISLIVTAGIGLFAFWQIKWYEDSVIDIYATQQDAYVQLVLDQINLLDDRSNMNIVNDILGTLDASSNRYWTLSQDEALIFVKDVSETNRYKGFTTETYYVSADARYFLSSLSINRVIHRLVTIDDREYIASGVKFAYNGSQYQICLVTNPDTVLDHNVYLSAKINLCIAISIVLILLIASVLTLTLLLEQREKKLFDIQQKNESLRLMIEKISAALQRDRLFDTRYSLFDISVYDQLIQKMAERNISMVTVVELSYQTIEDKDRFLTESQVLLDYHVIKFHDFRQKRIILVAIQCSKAAVMSAVNPFLQGGIVLDKVTTTETRGQSSGKEQEQKNGKQTIS